MKNIAILFLSACSILLPSGCSTTTKTEPLTSTARTLSSSTNESNMVGVIIPDAKISITDGTLRIPYLLSEASHYEDIHFIWSTIDGTLRSSLGHYTATESNRESIPRGNEAGVLIVAVSDDEGNLLNRYFTIIVDSSRLDNIDRDKSKLMGIITIVEDKNDPR